MRVLVFAAHPDDDLIGCGGSIARHVDDGSEVTIVYVTSGESGSLRHGKAELAAIREQEAAASSAALGVTDLVFLRQPDGYVEATPALLAEVTRLVRTKRPDLVYVPHRRDGHADHRATHALATEAVGRAAGPWFQECGDDPWSVRCILAYEVWTPLQEISYAEDVTDVIERKLAALALHRSQTADIAYTDAVRGLNRYRGAMTGKGCYCECFQVLRIDRLVGGA
jgi:N-acetylglucosamine malate deacetylase 1